jgi:DNA polymerase-3 subunit delta'
MGLPEERRAEFAKMFVSWMRLLFKLDMRTLSAWVDQTATIGRESQKRFLQYVQESLRACFLKSVAGIALPGELEFGDEKFDSSFPAMVTTRNVEKMNQALTDAIYAIERNAYAKITFMQLSFTMSKLIKNR